jgi:hypothetical protein
MPAMPIRSFPVSPRSTASLEVGDLIAVPCEPPGWACLQVVDLKRTGAGARTSFVAGVLPWRGQAPPTRGDVAGLAATEQGLVRIELFTDGGLQVVDHAEVVSTGLPSNFRDQQVGTVHTVWGWKMAIERAQAVT